MADENGVQDAPVNEAQQQLQWALNTLVNAASMAPMPMQKHEEVKRAASFLIKELNDKMKLEKMLAEIEGEGKKTPEPKKPRKPKPKK